MGQGYVGLPLAMRAVEVGHDVVGFEVDEARVKRLAAGGSYVEDVSSDHPAAALASGRYLPTADEAALAGVDVAVITVPKRYGQRPPDTRLRVRIHSPWPACRRARVSRSRRSRPR